MGTWPCGTRSGNLLIAAGEDEGSGLLMANNAAGVNIFPRGC